MAQLVGNDEIESLRIELTEIGESLRSSLQHHISSSKSSSKLNSVKDDLDNELALWAKIDRLPTFERLRSSLFDESDGSKVDVQGKRVVDVTKLGALERQMFVDKLIKYIENDNLRLLQKIRNRVDKVGVELPRVEVRYKNLRVEAKCEVVRGKPLPTLWNSLKSIVFNCAKLPGLKSREAKITIIDEVNGIIKPGRMTLLLGPPGCGKTTLLKALSGNLDKSLKVSGEVMYNGYKLEEFVPQKTSTYVSQHDLHMPEMTVRETLDFSARCQGVGNRAEIMVEVSRREKQAGIIPDPDVDTYMKAISAEGQRATLQTNYILKILGLDICADILVGDAMRRGISGGQKKRLTTGEMIIGPTKALFMDEMSNGLDSSTTYQIVACLKQLAHITNATILVALLQLAPETFDLFDDIILMEGGKIVYHGPRNCVLEFFENCGFRCPERKGVADFLQEVISRKDQAQYWHRAEQSWNYISVDLFCKKFKESNFGKKVDEDLSKPFTKSQSHKNAISFSKYSLPKWELFKACMSREYLLMRRNSFIYVFKTVQLVITAFIAMTVFLRTRMGVDVIHANNYLGALFFSLTSLFFDGIPESFMTVARLAVFYKQRDLYFYPAWSYAIPSTILKVPLSLFEALIWTSLTYYVIGYSPEPGRFFRQFILLFALHFAATSMFRLVASIFRTMAASSVVGMLLIVVVFLFSGFIIPEPSMPTWLKWGFWVSLFGYGEIGLSVNEFLAPRWQKKLAGNTTIGIETLENRGLYFRGYFFWLSVGGLLGLAILFNIGFTLALTFLNPPSSHAIISSEKLSRIEGNEDSSNGSDKEAKSKSYEKTTLKRHQDRLVLPFKPLTLAFQDVQYYIDTPLEMREKGSTQKQLQLLCDITGALRPGILTALMGVSGAGKTTLLDVLAGRKTSGYIEGDIRIGGYPKVQETFARISGYCEQSDVHSPQITVEESIVYSAWLRLHPEIDSKTKFEFVREVLEIIELDEIRDYLVGLPGVSGLSTEQRKRLTIAVELVANPSLIFMDEPTTGLDARAAAIVMRAVKNVADTGRTIVCTIHQPSIDIFEAFDELVILKNGGRIIYSGPLGQHSSSVVKYFEDISGIPKIRNNYNPATWILEVTSTTAEAKLGIDFSQIYKNSLLYQNNKALVITLSAPLNSKELHFTTRFSQNGWGQFKSCLWKQHLSYWRSPSYNLMRSMYLLITSLLFGILFWGQGRKINNQQSLFNVLGAIYSATTFLGLNNCSSVFPYVSMERSVLYRERFAGMYGSWAYALAQVTIEVPYLLAQAIVFFIITYPMIGYYWSAYKIFWYFYAMFCSLLYYTYVGMLLVAMTPSFPMATILQSVVYVMFNLFSGFFIPRPQIPKWWIWMYYLTPTSWTLKGILTSQYGDIQKEITVFGETKTVSAFLTDYFGYHHDQLPIVGVVLIMYPIVIASLFAYCIEKLNYQRR
ncbi:pleiotropic drug resistance protein 3-like isoform X3 [Rhododendron vialii]|uniref:pleiotropic drug resistance protein 3-like isoform X3 n=1 Tax=Rhododendron vialii TaxID=182163 RepID=UPI00265EA3A9|nr:pleiotropic drug resistance protein 3-like isoform X3 [Rhododendron vialii]